MTSIKRGDPIFLRLNFFFFLIGINLVLSGCRSEPSSVLSPEKLAEAAHIPPHALTAFVSFLENEIDLQIDQHGVPGLAITLVHDGQIAWTRGFGTADRERGTPVRADTRFQVASISKSLTALGVLKQVDGGSIELDAPIERYLSRWSVPESEFDSTGVTVRRLLKHEAGLSVSGYLGFHPDADLPSLEQSLQGALGSHSLLTWFYNLLYPSRHSVHLIAKPGDEPIYSGGGYTVLQLMLEEVTGQDFTSYMQDEILEPLGMHSSSYLASEQILSKVATAYTGFWSISASPNYLYTAKAAAGLYATSDDLARFTLPFLDNHENPVLSKSLAALMLEDELGTRRSKLTNGALVFSHTGMNMGDWNAVYRFVPHHRAALVVLTNGKNGQHVYRYVSELWLAWLSSTKSKTG